MPKVMITGANRGLGLEFVRQYVADGWEVIATCRHPGEAKDLNDLAEQHTPMIRVYPLAVDMSRQIEDLKAEIGDDPIDVLINNAGIFGPRAAKLGNLDPAAWRHVFEVNTIAPIKVAEAFVDNVEAAKGTIATVSSNMGSIENIPRGDEYIYRSSKAALNSAHRSLAFELEPKGITCAVMHPGWVRTDMGGPDADIEETESVSGMRALIAGLSLDQTGLFWNYDGERMPW